MWTTGHALVEAVYRVRPDPCQGDARNHTVGRPSVHCNARAARRCVYHKVETLLIVRRCYKIAAFPLVPLLYFLALPLFSHACSTVTP